MAQPVSASLAGPVPAPRPMLWAWPGPRGGFPVDVSVGHVSGFRPPEPSLRCRSCGISRSPRAFAHQGLTFRPLFHPTGTSHRSGSRHHPPPPRFETTADRPLPARRGETSMGRVKVGGDKALGLICDLLVFRLIKRAIYKLEKFTFAQIILSSHLSN